MLLDMHTANGVVDGAIRLAFRRWSTPRVIAGGTFVSPVGVVAIESIEPIEIEAITEDDAQAAGALSRDDLVATFRGAEDDPVFRIGLRWVGHDPRIALRQDAELSEHDVDTIRTKLDGMDRRSSSGPWTQKTLELIATNPGVRAADLAHIVDRGKDPFKLDVRKLKNLGLTHSLEIGYELSPRGRAFLDRHG